MKKPIIAVDIDDVLSHTAKEIIAYGNRLWGHEHTLEDFTEDLAELWQIDPHEVELRWQSYIDTGIIQQYDVIPEAADALRKLRGRFQLIAVTSRRPEIIGITEEWLDANYPGIIDKVISAKVVFNNTFHPYNVSKPKILQQIGAEYLIDDQPKHCKGAAEAGVQAVLFGGYPWNRDVELLEGVVRCDTWQAVLEYFDGIG